VQRQHDSFFICAKVMYKILLPVGSSYNNLLDKNRELLPDAQTIISTALAIVEYFSYE
jgi:hypothetical protein